LDILSKPVLTREKYIIPDDNCVSNYDEFDANLEYDIDGTGLKWVDAVFLSGVDNTKRVKYLNNYGEPVYAEDDDVDEEDEEDDDEEDDSRRSFVLFDERSGMGSAMHRSGMMNQSFMNQSFHPFYNLSRYADVLTEVLTEVDNEVLTKVDTTKRVKYLNNYGEPVYAEDDDVDEEDEEDDDEEDDRRRSFVLFDERSWM
jgi:ribosomal protein L12E/L44/L45/RPP1/RPP2